MEFKSGKTVNSGYYYCKNCGTEVLLKNQDNLPPCPVCGFNVFTKIKKS